MKLQLALDDISLVDALVLAEKVRDYVDIFEIGSPFIIQEGMRAVREFRRYFPKKRSWPIPRLWMQASMKLSLPLKLVRTTAQFSV
ncbi:D-arabino-3-hexulose 6-phosphate formaldehyde lyase [Lacticaseibacillus paracasei]|nr:D-arabino-3-hexulose 6-phosphate formaldehyde lyase [Lacticaseibacillus paracasei]